MGDVFRNPYPDKIFPRNIRCLPCRRSLNWRLVVAESEAVVLENSDRESASEILVLRQFRDGAAPGRAFGKQKPCHGSRAVEAN